MLAQSSPAVENNMEHRRIQGWEKVQVQLAAVAALAVVYLGLWHRFWPWDPQSAVAYLPAAAHAQLLGFAAMVLVLAAAVAVLTMSTRPQGALLVVLIGAGGISLRSPQIRALFWAHPGQFQWVFGQLLLESLVMAVVLGAAYLVILTVRGALRSIMPGVAWKSPIQQLTAEQRETLAQKIRSGQLRDTHFVGPVGMVIEAARSAAEQKIAQDIEKDGERAIARSHWTHAAGCAGLTFVISVVAMFLLMQSGDRGQVIFALFASFLVGSLAGHQLVPTRWGAVLPATPLAAAVLFYALAAYASIAVPSPQAWMAIPKYAQALPIDWLTAGSGGAVVGYWISSRLHELRLMEALEEQQE